MESSSVSKRINTVVIVHGGLVDGSGWRGVYDILSDDGFNVSVVQNSTASLQGDVSVTKLALDEQVGPVVLIGHSYGGAVVTEVGNHPKVERLVYITAFAPDNGESVNTFIANPPPGAPVPPILPPRDGYLFLDKSEISQPRSRPTWTRRLQSSWLLHKCRGASKRSAARLLEPAWKTKPSWYLLVTDDRMIPIAAQRFMGERTGSKAMEVPDNHAIYVSNPRAVATVIQSAASAKLAVHYLAVGSEVWAHCGSSKRTAAVG